MPISPTRLPDTLEDIWDGSNVAENALFQSDPKSLGLILYQDAFEVANPLGSGKKKQNKTKSSCSVFFTGKCGTTQQVKCGSNATGIIMSRARF